MSAAASCVGSERIRDASVELWGTASLGGLVVVFKARLPWVLVGRL